MIDRAVISQIDHHLKRLFPFRPFAPAILEELADDYFLINQASSHMLIAAQAKDSGKEKAPAPVHVDNSSRVQTESKKDNLRFYDLLKVFYELTDCPILFNTSFNVKGQPIVNSPLEAIDCFYRRTLTAL